MSRGRCLTKWLLLCTVCIGSLGATEAATFTPMEDGLLVTGRTSLRAQAASWRVVVVVHTSLDLSIILRELKTLEAAVSSISPGRVSELALQDWSGRFKKLRVALNTPRAEERNPERDLWRRRSRRGLLDAVGTLASFAFGVATEQEVMEVQEAVDKTRKQGRAVAHLVTELTSVVNGSRELIRENRRRLNEVATLVGQLADTENTTRRLLKHAYNMQTQQNIDRVLEHIEREYAEYRERERQQARQKTALEMGRLTEDLLSLPTLIDILRRATQEDVVPVEPAEWYYQHTRIIPLWGDGTDSLVFKVELPLVRPVPYLGYKIRTYEVPYANSTTTVRLQAEGRYGLDTQTGAMFNPKICAGTNPQVCQAGPLYSSGGLDCARAVISARDTRKVCRVQVVTRPDDSPQILTTEEPNRFVLLTWGETLTEHCTGRAERTYTLRRGTYSVTIQGGCILKSRAWSVRGLIERNSSVSRNNGAVPVHPINLRDLLPPETAFSLPKREHPLFPDLGEVASVTLGDHSGDLADSFEPIRWKTSRKWWLLLLVPCALLAAMIAGFYLRRRLRNLKSTLREETQQDVPAPELKSPVESSPGDLAVATTSRLLSHRSYRRPIETDSGDELGDEPPQRRQRLNSHQSVEL